MLESEFIAACNKIMLFYIIVIAIVGLIAIAILALLFVVLKSLKLTSKKSMLKGIKWSSIVIGIAVLIGIAPSIIDITTESYCIQGNIVSWEVKLNSPNGHHRITFKDTEGKEYELYDFVLLDDDYLDNETLWGSIVYTKYSKLALAYVPYEED